MYRSFWLGVAPWILATAVFAEELPEIRYHAIVEADVGRVWEAVSVRSRVAQWFAGRVYQWSPRAGQPFRIGLPGEMEVTGRFLGVEPQRSFQLEWSESSDASTADRTTSLVLTVTPVDDYLTMLSLVHGGWSSAGAVEDIRRRRDDMSDYWRAAFMKLHRLFKPALVDTRMHRPRVEGVYVDRSLVINGGFESGLPGEYDGVAFGWQTSTAKSSPQVHAVDDAVSYGRGHSQRLKNPPDWTNYVVQQWTPQTVAMIQPGKRYRLTGWVKSEGIRNPAGWYKLGLWFMTISGQPIGDFLKNEKRTDADGNVMLNHDWHRFTIEGVAPPNAGRAVVILSGHWDEHGICWYDDVTLWEVEAPPTTKQK